MDGTEDSDEDQSADALPAQPHNCMPDRLHSPERSIAQRIGCLDDLRLLRSNLLNRNSRNAIDSRHVATTRQGCLNFAEFDNVYSWDGIDGPWPSIRGGVTKRNRGNDPTTEILGAVAPDGLSSIALTVAQTTGNTSPPSRSLHSTNSRYFHWKRRPRHARAYGLNRQGLQSRRSEG